MDYNALYIHKETCTRMTFMFRTNDGIIGMAQPPNEGYAVALVTEDEFKDEFEKVNEI